LLAAAFDLGFRHFDTSPFYGHGIAERELGRFARRRRGDLLIATKFGITPNPVFARFPWLMYAQLSANAVQRRITKTNGLAVMPTRDYSAHAAQLSLERSLRALRSDHVDIFFVHDPKPASLGFSDELLTTLDRLRREGKARYVGVAGAAGDCIDVARLFPTMAQITQIDASAGTQEFTLLRKAGLSCHFSYGHFRDRSEPIESLLSDAMNHNQTGVILYSSRYLPRLAQVVAQLAHLESR
jgi:aryl-alcohol dehydrogenase-like predicted oxidoreductase